MSFINCLRAAGLRSPFEISRIDRRHDRSCLMAAPWSPLCTRRPLKIEMLRAANPRFRMRASQ
jgi:hypothetical protein